VLIVEDDQTARNAIRLILTRHGFAVSEAGTVGEAVASLTTHVPHWVLLDLMLPDGSGVNVLHHARREGLASRVCVVTGCCGDLLSDAIDAGAEHAFTKPLDVARLVQVMAK